ncbi:hypothetical protein C8Q80DRAFT_1217567 [Daedaleopsis nitida]|nr:hypothetical protein C8Q80DRAFT_1217567 [Daedaleopsis nitida]
MPDAPPANDLPEVWDWEIVQDDWWRTSFRAISWAYKTKPDHPRPPHYHDLLARGRRRRIGAVPASAQEEDVSLNAGLSGVRAAEDSLKRYELDAAITPSTPLLQDGDDRDGRLLEQHSWLESLRELLGELLEDGPLPEVESLSPDVPLWDLDNLESPIPSSESSAASSVDGEELADANPLHSTPKPKSAPSYARAVSSGVVTNAPTVLSPLPSKALSKAALPFIPATPARPASQEPTTPPLTSSSDSSDSPYSSPTYNFHFPSLNSASPTDRNETRSLPQMRKLDSGFWVDLSSEDVPATQSLSATRSGTPRRPSTALLPSFLTDGSSPSRAPRPRRSTREMVDEVRSSGRKSKRSNRRQHSLKDADLSTLLSDAALHSEASAPKSDDTSEGWIRAASVSEGSSFGLVVTDDGWILQSNHPQSTSPSPPASQPKPKHGHKRSSPSASTTHSSSPPSSASTFSPASSTLSLNVPTTPATVPSQLPAMPQLYSPPAMMPYPPYASPYAAAPAAAYMHMYQSARAPWPMGYQAGVYPMYQPFGVMPGAVPYGMVPVAPMQPAAMFYDAHVHGKGKQ